MNIQILLLSLIGLCAGIITAAGIVALINVVGIIPRLVKKLRAPDRPHSYETCVILGGTVGNLHTLYSGMLSIPPVIRGGYAFIFSGFCGIYVGCLVMALAETLQVLPIFIRHIHLQHGLPQMLLAFALGKLAGSLWYFLYF